MGKAWNAMNAPTGDSIKVVLLTASLLIFLVVFVFTGVEGIIQQLNRQLMDALVYYLISVASLTALLWSYARSKQLMRALPIWD